MNANENQKLFRLTKTAIGRRLEASDDAAAFSEYRFDHVLQCWWWDWDRMLTVLPPSE